MTAIHELQWTLSFVIRTHFQSIIDYNDVVYIVYYIMDGDNNNSIEYDNKNSKAIIIRKDSNLQLSNTSSSSSSTNIADTVHKKDERLELVEISKGLIEILHDAGFTVESILENEPSHIAEILGIDVYVGEIIYNETKKVTSNVNSNFLIN